MSNTPLYDAYRQFLANSGTPFTTPGHKRNPALVDDLLAQDVPHWGGVEDRRVSRKLLQGAQRIAADMWGADWCHYSVQGSTHGNQAMSPHDAFFSDHERVSADQAVGRIAAETAAPYPPGVPALAPGERIQGDVLAALQAEAASGTRIAYCGDPRLETVLVVKE